MQIISHRSLHEGVKLAQENTISAASFCLERGWGIETDIRRALDGRFYISHNPAIPTEANQAESFCALFRQFPTAVVALNIKELGYEADLLQFLIQQQVQRQVFLFDMELLEGQPGQTARLFRKLDSQIKIAARMSDRGEGIERALSIPQAEIIWLDEFDRLWVTESDIWRLKSAGKVIYAISPEIHGFSLEQMSQRWCEFNRWGVDGICTDYSLLLEQKLTAGFEALI